MLNTALVIAFNDKKDHIVNMADTLLNRGYLENFKRESDKSGKNINN